MKQRNAILDFFFGALMDDREMASQQGDESVPAWQLAAIGVMFLIAIGFGARCLFG